MSFFSKGFKAMLPITTGVIPFGAVMGTVSADAGLTFSQTMIMNVIVFAGASQLAAVDLMLQNAASAVVIVTGLIINLRFILYSAALSPVVQKSNFLVKVVAAYCITDQNYAVMSANEKKFTSNAEALEFYLGASLCMVLAWDLAVVGGFVFGNFAPQTWALEFAVPLSFIALVMPTMKKGRVYLAVAIFSSIVSVLLHHVPYKLGLIITSLLAIAFGIFLSRKGAAK
jgi:predicted branched-subunit amino acid permease